MDIYDSVQKIIETMERTSSTMKRENRFFGNPETSQNHKEFFRKEWGGTKEILVYLKYAGKRNTAEKRG